MHIYFYTSYLQIPLYMYMYVYVTSPVLHVHTYTLNELGFLCVLYICRSCDHCSIIIIVYIGYRSCDQSRPGDQPGASPEDDSVQRPASQLAEVAHLFEQLQATLDTDGAVENAPGEKLESQQDTVNIVDLSPESPSPSPSLPFASMGLLFREGSGKTHTCDDNDLNISAVYSRCSSILLTPGSLPNLEGVVQKDLNLSQRTEVTVILPDIDSDTRRWTRSGTRALFGSCEGESHLYSLRDGETSSDFADSDSNAAVSEPGARKKKRAHQKSLQRSSVKPSYCSNGEEVHVVGEMVRREYNESGDCERDTPPYFEFPSPVSQSASISSPLSSPSDNAMAHILSSGASSMNTAGNISSAFLPDSGVEVSGVEVSEGNGASCEMVDGKCVIHRRHNKPSLKPCTLNITPLPKHIVNKHIAKVSDMKGKVHSRSDRSTSPVSSSSIDSTDSLSILNKPPPAFKVPKGSEDNDEGIPDSGNSTHHKSLTPQRSRIGKEPVAKRSLPFSKPPRSALPSVFKRAGAVSSRNIEAVPINWSTDDDFETNPLPPSSARPSPAVGDTARKERSAKEVPRSNGQSSGKRPVKGKLLPNHRVGKKEPKVSSSLSNTHTLHPSAAKTRSNLKERDFASIQGRGTFTYIIIHT